MFGQLLISLCKNNSIFPIINNNINFGLLKTKLQRHVRQFFILPVESPLLNQ